MELSKMFSYDYSNVNWKLWSTYFTGIRFISILFNCNPLKIQTLHQRMVSPHWVFAYILKIRINWKYLSTHFTGKWFISSVHSHMFFKNWNENADWHTSDVNAFSPVYVFILSFIWEQNEYIDLQTLQEYGFSPLYDYLMENSLKC